MALVNDLPTGRSPESGALLNSNTTYDSQTTYGIEMNGATSAETLPKVWRHACNADTS